MAKERKYEKTGENVGATVTFNLRTRESKALLDRLRKYVEEQRVPPAHVSVIRTALDEFLEREGY